MPSSSDLFSRQSAVYASARPTYPEAFYSAIAALTSAHDVVWDCGCGSGQATHALTAHYGRVVATDISAEQIACALEHPQVEYAVCGAEDAVHVAEQSVDLITVATAVHWFDVPRFYEEALRVLVPGGVLAVWAYSGHTISPEIDAWTARYAREVVGSYWRKDRLNLLHDHYASLPPIPSAMVEVTSELEEKDWAAQQHMTLHGYENYLRSWSASQAYVDAHSADPLASAQLPSLSTVWGDACATRLVSWPLFVRVFRKKVRPER